MNTGHVLAAALGSVWLLAAQAGSAGIPPAAPVIAMCAELPFDSYPPNQLLRHENEDGSAVSILQPGKSRTWSQFFVEVDRPGTYRVDVASLPGPDRAIFQLIVDGEPVGDPVDCYAANPEGPMQSSLGDATFHQAGSHSFRFLVTGRNPASSSTFLTLQGIKLTPVQGFTLASPNGSCQQDSSVLLRWHAWPGAARYRVEIDGRAAATLDASATVYAASNLAAGSHRWRVVAVEPEGKQKPSNVFSFVIGAPPPYPCREFTDDFSSTTRSAWSVESMKVAQDANGASLEADGPGSAVSNDVRLDKTEGEIAVEISPKTEDAAQGVGFQADDGTRLYAVVDLKRQQLRIERSLQGTARYSIFEVTPSSYQVPGWAERAEGDRTIWEIAAKPIQIRAGISYQLKLAYSRRSACVMASLVPSDGSPTVTLRDLTDLRTPDHPLLIALSGRTGFGRVSFRLLNKLVYQWDPDSTRIVLRPGGSGTWDQSGAFNPAVLVHDGVWYMIYRGNFKPAPPNGPPSSDLGLATSKDGIHWLKNPNNPIIRKEDPAGTKEDPDLIWPKGSDQVYLEYVSRHAPAAAITAHGEVMCSGVDFVHWGAPWALNTGRSFGKMGGFIDAQAGLDDAGIQCGGAAYRYVAMIEEGRIDVSNDLHEWIKAGTADLRGTPDKWCNNHECSGDIFVDQDKNIRFESQIGVKPESGHGGAIVGNRLCTIGEGVLSGSDPTKVLWRSDLPWLTDWYGDAPTNAPEDFTATNGSVFPGQTIIKDGWLWHYSGGNNHCTLLTKCWYGPRLECRDLQAATDASGQCSVRVIVRNIGSLNGSCAVTLSVDGETVSEQQVTLDRDAETTFQRNVPIPAGVHTLAVDHLSVTIQR